jgi:phage terminase small subunit
MTTLGNSRHEAFARGLALGKTADKAYEDAGYKRNRFNASRLRTNEHVLRRVQELNGKASEKAVLDKAWVLERLMKNARIAMGEEKITLSTKDGEEVATIDRDVSGANRALELLGKELGMFIERSENLNTNYNISDKPMDEDDWAEEYAESSDAVH